MPSGFTVLIDNKCSVFADMVGQTQKQMDLNWG